MAKQDLVAKFSGATGEAVRLVVLKGLSQGQAAKQAGIDRAAVSRAITSISVVKTCPCCGHQSKELKS